VRLFFPCSYRTHGLWVWCKHEGVLQECILEELDQFFSVLTGMHTRYRLIAILLVSLPLLLNIYLPAEMF
jgi:hypothetical protein